MISLEHNCSLVNGVSLVKKESVDSIGPDRTGTDGPVRFLVLGPNGPVHGSQFWELVLPIQFPIPRWNWTESGTNHPYSRLLFLASTVVEDISQTRGLHPDHSQRKHQRKKETYPD